VKNLKQIDKLLKKLKTDRNTFCTFILLLLTIYFLVDRVVEMLMIIFTGISSNYWGPLMYTFALACPIFAFLFSGSSKFNKSDKLKLNFFYTYCIALYIIAVSMVVQWVNAGIWIGLLSLPNYSEIAIEFSYLIRPALSSIAIYLPLTTFFPLIKWLYGTIADTKDIRDSIIDYGGIDLSDKTAGRGQYTCTVTFGTDKKTGAPIEIPEAKRFESMLVVGPSGSGKTSLIFEPMIAKDMDKKYFFKEVSKEMGFTALKTGIAALNCPYGNDYINSHFNLNMLIPNENKKDLYDAYMKKMILGKVGGTYKYRNLGITYLSPDFESTQKMIQVAENYKLPYNLVDPTNPDSPGLNPFIYSDPVQTSVAISSVLKGLYHLSAPDMDVAFRENVANQAIENVSILLKLVYPRLHEGSLPTLEDMLDIFTNPDKAEELCEYLKEDPELADEYKILIHYFEKNFYATGAGREDTEKYIYTASTQLDNLLRYPGIKNILCNRTNNLNFDDALDNGEITLVCTRRGDLGVSAHKAFGLFFLLLMQYSVLRRPGNENNRVPHFLYIDEFPSFICSSTEAIFTIYRKYRVATVISAQNLAQLNVENGKYRQTITANCANKVVFGNCPPEEADWWEKEMEEKKEWKSNKSYNTDEVKYDSKQLAIEFAHKPNYKAGKIKALTFKSCIYKTKNLKGKSIVGKGKLDFLDAKYKEPKSVKTYNFEKFTNGISQEATNHIFHKKKKAVVEKELDDSVEFDPINTDNRDSKFLFDNEDAIIVNLKRGNTNNKI